MPAPGITARDVFDHAFEIESPQERQAYLDEVCADAPGIRRQVEALLEAYEQAGSQFLKPVDAPDRMGPYRPASDTPGEAATDPRTADHVPLNNGWDESDDAEQQIGPYRLIEKLGEGGMGSVYLAQQEKPIRRQVALKLIRPGMDSAHVIARFEAERQALTMMDHVNIARVFDAGSTAKGQPYFVMELITGVTLVRYCNENQLSIRQRLALFVSICQAVQHAHQRGVMHRDLKPSNILVAIQDGQPVPKVIDFGLAKAIEQPLTEHDHLTQVGLAIGTFNYMSPEQANGSERGVDTRTDIYALGVILYELLTGAIAIDHRGRGGLSEAVRRIQEEIPPTPSARVAGLGERLAKTAAERATEPDKLAKSLRGELDWITMKALEKERERRYESASAFAGDVQRYLNDEPVLACPPTRRYLLGKFVRKNRRLLASLGAILLTVAAATAAVVGILLWSLFRVDQARNNAVAAADLHRQGNWTLMDGLRLLLRSEKRSEMEESVIRGIEQHLLKLEASGVSTLAASKAETQHSLANLSMFRGDRPAAETRYLKAIEMYQQLLEAEPKSPEHRNELARTYFDYAHLLHLKDDSKGSAAAFMKAIELSQGVLSEFPEAPAYKRELADGYNDLGVTLRDDNRLEEAERAFRDAIKLGEEAKSGAPEEVPYRVHLAVSYGNLGNVIRDQGRPKESLEFYGKCTALLKPIKDVDVRSRPLDPHLLKMIRQLVRNVCWDRANARTQLGLHADAVRDWKGAIDNLDKQNGTEKEYFERFLAAAKMEVKLQQDANPSAAMLYEAAVLSAVAYSCAHEAKERTQSEWYSRRTLELLTRAKSAGWFSDSRQVKEFLEDSRFQEISAVEEFQKFRAGLK
jgi:serine/threonine protein kinase/tetratricopeptide (TPR) repeat protein